MKWSILGLALLASFVACGVAAPMLMSETGTSVGAGGMVDPIVQEAERLNARDKAEGGLRDMDADSDWRAASMALKEASQIPDMKENQADDAQYEEAQQFAMIQARREQQMRMEQLSEPVLSAHAQSMLQMPPDAVNIGQLMGKMVVSDMFDQTELAEVKQALILKQHHDVMAQKKQLAHMAKSKQAQGHHQLKENQLGEESMLQTDESNPSLQAAKADRWAAFTKSEIATMKNALLRKNDKKEAGMSAAMMTAKIEAATRTAARATSRLKKVELQMHNMREVAKQNALEHEAEKEELRKMSEKREKEHKKREAEEAILGKREMDAFLAAQKQTQDENDAEVKALEPEAVRLAKQVLAVAEPTTAVNATAAKGGKPDMANMKGMDGMKGMPKGMPKGVDMKALASMLPKGVDMKALAKGADMKALAKKVDMKALASMLPPGVQMPKIPGMSEEMGESSNVKPSEKAKVYLQTKQQIITTLGESLEDEKLKLGRTEAARSQAEKEQHDEEHMLRDNVRHDQTKMANIHDKYRKQLDKLASKMTHALTQAQISKRGLQVCEEKRKSAEGQAFKSMAARADASVKLAQMAAHDLKQDQQNNSLDKEEELSAFTHEQKLAKTSQKTVTKLCSACSKLTSTEHKLLGADCSAC